MLVEVLHVPDCPNAQPTLARLDEALAAVGRAARVTSIVIETTDAARARGMRGSPTVLIDGTDPFETPGGGGELACRRFRTAAGLAGAPTTDQLIAALSLVKDGSCCDST